MKLTRYSLGAFLLIFSSINFSWIPGSVVENTTTAKAPLALDASPFKVTDRKGRLENAPKMEDNYTLTSIAGIDNIKLDRDVIAGLKKQLDILDKSFSVAVRKGQQLDINREKLRSTIQLLLQNEDNQPLGNLLNAWQLKGKDGRGNVYFTGYYTPVIQARRTKEANFTLPVFSKKDATKPMAWLQDKGDMQKVRMQGSAILEFPDGQKLRYTLADMSVQPVEGTDEENTGATKSSTRSWKASGAAGVTLSEDFTVAVDTRYIPLGSVLLAAVPVRLPGKVIRHEYRLLLAQDKGGAIDGPGRIDLYCGDKPHSEKKALDIHHFGRVWLLLPKPNQA